MATDLAEPAVKIKTKPVTRQRPPAATRSRGTVVPLMKKLCYWVLGVACFMTLLFLLDIFVTFPFARASVTLDIFGILSGALVAYLAWDTAREIR
jgi:hypothetical protein